MWLKVFASMSQICSEWPLLQEVAAGSSVSIEAMAKVKAMQPWELLNTAQKEHLTDLKEWFDENVLAKVNKSFIAAGSAPLKKMHKSIGQISIMLTEEKPIADRLQHCFGMKIDLEGDPGPTLVKYVSTDSDASLFTGLHKLTQVVHRNSFNTYSRKRTRSIQACARPSMAAA